MSPRMRTLLNLELLMQSMETLAHTTATQSASSLMASHSLGSMRATQGSALRFLRTIPTSSAVTTSLPGARSFLSRAFSSEAASTSRTTSAESAAKMMTEPGFVGHKPMSSKNLPAERGPVTWWSFLATLALGGAVLYKFREDRDAKVEKYRHEGSMGKAAIGGPFKLTAHDGKPFDSEELKGQFTMIYFGFTQCPDACPEALYKLGDALKLLAKDGIHPTPVFITVDPERDVTHEVAAYVHDFAPNMIGLTGGVEQVKGVARQFRVYYNKVQEDGPNDYLVDHTIIQYLMDPAGDFVTFYAKNSSAEDMYASIKEIVEDYEKKHPDYDRKRRPVRTEELSAVAAQEAVRATQLRRHRRGWLGWLKGRN